MSKILFIYYQNINPGGVARVLVNLANELCNEGYEVSILFLMNGDHTFYDINPNIKTHILDSFGHWGVKKTYPILDKYLKKFKYKINLKKYIFDFSQWSLMNQWLKKNHHNYEIIISSWYKLSSQISANKKIAKKTFAWEHVAYQTGGFLYNDLPRRYYKNLKGIVCINSASLKYYEQFNTTYFIANIIGFPFENQTDIRIQKKKNLISFVGRLDKEKNVLELLQIFKKTNLPQDWSLQIIGDGVERHNLETYVKENNLNKKVFFLGVKSSDEILELLRKSKIFAFTSLKESFGNVLVEAIFCGNAIISYNCNYGPSDIVTNKIGYLIKLGDKEKFQEKLFELTNDNSKLETYIKNSIIESEIWRKETILAKWRTILHLK